jgi:hypothetical protein
MIDSRDILKSFFQIGDVPTDVQFADLIDSYVHKTDDGVTVYDLTDPAPDPNNPAKRFGVGVTIPESRLSVLADKLNGNMISFHSLPSPAVADWVLNLAPGANPGFSINQSVAGGDKRFFIQNGSGFVGIGTKTPGQLLHLEGLKGDSPLGLQLRNLAATSNRGFIMGHNIGTDAEPSQNGHLTFLEVLADGSKQERFTISNGGKVGVGIYNPDTLMHAFGSYNAPLTRIALAPNRGILEVGQVEKYNLLFDTRGIQARDADTPDPTKPNEIVVKFSDLSIQPLGGDISFHDQLTAPADQEKKAILTRDGRFGVGLTNPQERMDLNGAIRIGEAVNSNPGTIRYSNASGAYDIEGFVDGSWQSLTGNGSSAWAAVTGGINYGGGNVGIGGIASNVKLSVAGGIKIGDNADAVAGTIRYSNQTSGLYTFEGNVQGVWVDLAGGGGTNPWQDVPGGISYTGGDVGIGGIVPGVRFSVNGGIKIGDNTDAVAGTIRYSNQTSGSYTFEGNVQGVWVDLAGGGNNPWQDVTGGINYAGGDVGIGGVVSGVKFNVNGGIKIGDSSAPIPGTIRYSNQPGGNVFQGNVGGNWVNLSGGGGTDHWQEGSGNIHYVDGNVGIGTAVTNAMLQVRKNVPSDFTAAAIVENRAPASAAQNSRRVSLELTNPADWTGNPTSYDIGLYVSDIRGISGKPESSLAAVMNGNVVIGNLIDGTSMVGLGGKNILTIKRGSRPQNPVEGIQIYVDNNGMGEDCFHLINSSNDNRIKLYREEPLTPANNTPIPENFLQAMSIIDNMRTRINELEERMTAFGLI